MFDGRIDDEIDAAGEQSVAGNPPEAPVDRALSRRGLVRISALGTAGLAGLALAGAGFQGTAAQDATAEADPEADPEAEGDAEGGDVTVYSGRSEELVEELIEETEAATGIDVAVRYAGTAELAAQILEEGDNSPADIFFSQDAGALGALAKEGLLAPLPQETLDRVDARFRSPDGLWIGLSGRARVAVYNTDELTETDLPASILDFTDEAWSGRVGWAPENASFQSFVTALRVLNGEDAAREWLEGMIANQAVAYDGNSAVVRAVAAGEVQVGLVNHYYAYEIQAEDGPLPIANHFFAAGDPGSLINVAGVGILASSQAQDQALEIVEHLLGTDAQTYFAEQTFEYPLVEDVPTAEGLTPLAEVQGPEIDLSNLDDLEGTLTLLAEVGLI